MLTNLNCYFNLSFVRPSVRLVIKKLKGGGIKTQKFFALLFCCFFSTEHMFFWFHSLIRHIQMLNHLNCYFNMSFVRPSVRLVINRLCIDSSPSQFLNDFLAKNLNFPSCQRPQMEMKVIKCKHQILIISVFPVIFNSH